MHVEQVDRIRIVGLNANSHQPEEEDLRDKKGDEPTGTPRGTLYFAGAAVRFLHSSTPRPDAPTGGLA